MNSRITFLGAVLFTGVVGLIACDQNGGGIALPTCAYRAMINRTPVIVAVGATTRIWGMVGNFGKCKPPANPPKMIVWQSSNNAVARFTETSDTAATLMGVAPGTAVIWVDSPETQTADSTPVTVRAP